MKKFFLCLALLSQSLLAITIIGSPDVEINTEGTYLVQIKISSVSELKEEDISITDFKSDNELSDFNFEFRLFENLLNYKRLTLAIPKDYAEDYISFPLSTAVLNLNNIRDHQSDKASGKNTLVVRMGVERAKIYHYLLLITAYIGFTFSTIAVLSPSSIFSVLVFVFLIPHIQKVRKVEDYRNLDTELKKVALFCFLLSVISFTIAYFK